MSGDAPQHDSVDLAAPAPAAPRPAPPEAREWDDAPLRNKLALLIMLAIAGGMLVERIDLAAGHRFLSLALCLAGLTLCLLWLSRHWVWMPVDRLVRGLGKIDNENRLPPSAKLPVQRHDEVGQIARSFHDLAARSIRDQQEARRLRRTLDHRIAQATREATRQLRNMVMRDALTELGNRRFLEEHFEPLFKSVLDSGEDLACIVLDLDNFKNVNDTLGHAAGDGLLTFLGSLLRASVRHEDYAIRLGGDEFVVLMPGCDVARAEQFAQRISALFRQHAKATLPPNCPTGLSIGVASLALDRPPTSHELLACADAKLYAAKRAGKNRVLA